MGKLTDTKGIRHASLALMILSQFSSLVGAKTNITFYIPDTCGGAGYSCIDIESNRCCYFGQSSSAGSVTVLSDSISDECIGGYYYYDGACTTQVLQSTSGPYCAGVGFYTGAKWFNTCNRRRSLSELDSETSTSDSPMKPNAVVFTDDGNKGNWVLPSSNATELFSIFTSVPDEEKLNWIKSQGAIYESAP